MAGNLAEKQINKAVGWGFYPNSNNLVLHEAETRMNSGTAGGGGQQPQSLSGFRRKTQYHVMLNSQLLLLPNAMRLTREGARRVFQHLQQKMTQVR